MTHLGFFNTSGTRTHVRFPLSTFAAAGGNVAPSSAFEAADIRIYRAADGAALDAAQRATASGITMTSPFDALTGFHSIDIDLTDNSDAGFYASGYSYFVVLAPDETVDGQTLTAVPLACFEIGVPGVNVTQLGGNTQSATDLKDFADEGYDPTTNKVAGLQDIADDVDDIHVRVISAKGTVVDATPSASGFTTGLTNAQDNFYNDQEFTFTSGALTGQSRIVTAYNGTTKEVTFDEPFTSAPANGDAFSIHTGHVHSVTQIQAGLATDADLDTVAAGVASILADTNDIQTRLPASLVGGRIDASVGAMANNTVTAAATAADLVAEIQSGLATPADIPTVGQVADAVWDEQLSGHAAAGSAGAALSAASAAGDPWATDLPGSYDPGTAGYIIGHNIDAQISDIIGGPQQSVVIGPGTCDEVQRFDLGEIKPVGARLAATGGTFTISSVTVTFADAEDNALYGIEDLAATGFDAGALASPRAWYVLDTVTPPSSGPITAGTYKLTFTFVGTTSDGIERTHEIEIVIPIT